MKKVLSELIDLNQIPSGPLPCEVEGRTGTYHGVLKSSTTHYGIVLYPGEEVLRHVDPSTLTIETAPIPLQQRIAIESLVADLLRGYWTAGTFDPALLKKLKPHQTVIIALRRAVTDTEA